MESTQGVVFYRFWFSLLFLYFCIDLLKLHDFFNLGFLKPGMITIVSLWICIACSQNLKMIYNKCIILIVMFVFWLMLSIFFANNTFYAYNTFMNMFNMLPMCISIYLISINNKSSLIIKSLLIINFFSIIYGILNNGVGIGGYIKDENDLALFSVIVLPLLLLMFNSSTRAIYKLIFFVNIILTLYCVVLTFSRGGFLGLLVVGLVYFVLSHKKIVCISLLFFFLISGSYIVSEDYLQEMSSVSDTEESTAKARLETWQSGWNMFLDNPLGVGAGNFPVRFPDYQTDWFTRGMWGRVAHSLWFTLIPETGIIGTLLYFSIILNVLSILNKIKKSSVDVIHGYCNYDLYISLSASLLGFFVMASFLSVLYYPFFWIIVSLLAALGSICENENNSSLLFDVEFRNPPRLESGAQSGRPC